MKNQTKQQGVEYKNDPVDRINISVLTIKKEQFHPNGNYSFAQSFKVFKSEEQILIDIMGKLIIPVNPLNTTRSLPWQN